LHVQLKALTDNLDEPLMWKYLQEVSVFTEREKNLADVVLQVIVNSNMEKVQKWKGSEQTMCEALRVLMADELNEERVEGRIEGQREGKIRAYASLVQDGIITVETGAEKAGMSVDDFTKEMKLAGYVIPAV
jgi:predicted HTH domain antitoxin